MPVDRLITPDHRRRLDKRQTIVIYFLPYVGGYAALIGWFKYVDVYHAHFDDTGILILLHNLFRVVFVFYLFWMIQAAGAILLRAVGRLRPDDIGVLNYLAMSFFAGAGPWQVALLAVGYAGLLNTAAIVLLATPMVALSFQDFRVVLPRLRAGLAQVAGETALFKSLVVVLGLSWAALLIVKGLYPGNGVVYYEPYFETYKAFLIHGSLWPHESWWTSFYAQGAGLFFLGMLLTDAMAVQLVTFCLMSVAGLVIFLLVRNFAPRTYWPLVGASLFFAIFVYTPGWGEFRKLHEFNTAFVIAICWLTAMAFGSTGPSRKIWLCAAASTLAAAIVVSNYIGVFLGGVFTLLTLVYFALGERVRAVCSLGMAIFAGVLVACTLAINYAAYGLFNGWDPSLLRLWRFADIEKVYRLGALPTVIEIVHRVSTDTAAGAKIPWRGFLMRSLRLEVLWPLWLGGILVALFALRKPPEGMADGKRRVGDAAIIFAAALATFVPFALLVGRSQSPTFYRFSSFTIPLMIVAGIALWSAPPRRAKSPLPAYLKSPAAPLAVLVLCVAMLVGKTRFDPDVPRLGAHALEYTAGMISIDDAYAQRSVGGLAVPTDLHSTTRKIYAIVGPHTPVWSLSAFTFCVIPDCRIMSALTAILVPEFDRVLWGTPEEARARLQQAGLNYFMFSSDLPPRSPLTGSLLFSPDNIGRNLGIRWTDGTTTLLTWPGPDTVPIDDKWLAEYRRALALIPNRSWDGELKAIFDRLHGVPHPWHPSDLPLPQR
jgi:hypothetical protein